MNYFYETYFIQFNANYKTGKNFTHEIFLLLAEAIFHLSYMVATPIQHR